MLRLSPFIRRLLSDKIAAGASEKRDDPRCQPCHVDRAGDAVRMRMRNAVFYGDKAIDPLAVRHR